MNSTRIIKWTRTFSLNLWKVFWKRERRVHIHTHLHQSDSHAKHRRNEILFQTKDFVVCFWLGMHCSIACVLRCVSSRHSSQHRLAFASSGFIIIIIIYRTIFIFRFAPRFLAVRKMPILECCARIARRRYDFDCSACLFIAKILLLAIFCSRLFVCSHCVSYRTFNPSAISFTGNFFCAYQMQRPKYVIMLDVRAWLCHSMCVCLRILPINRFCCNVYSSRLRSVVACESFNCSAGSNVCGRLFVALNAGDACPQAILNTKEKLEIVADSHEIHDEKDTRMPHHLRVSSIDTWAMSMAIIGCGFVHSCRTHRDGMIIIRWQMGDTIASEMVGNHRAKLKWMRGKCHAYGVYRKKEFNFSLSLVSAIAAG